MWFFSLTDSARRLLSAIISDDNIPFHVVCPYHPFGLLLSSDSFRRLTLPGGCYPRSFPMITSTQSAIITWFFSLINDVTAIYFFTKKSRRIDSIQNRCKAMTRLISSICKSEYWRRAGPGSIPDQGSIFFLLLLFFCINVDPNQYVICNPSIHFYHIVCIIMCFLTPQSRPVSHTVIF